MKSMKDLRDISDGKIYDINDLVKADTSGCSGCSDCCHGVGELVALTPYDVYEIIKKTGMSFDELLGNKIELRIKNKILIPHLKMNGDSERCSFLNEEDRCTIHDSRPNICRLFPLGRIYENNDFKYFLQIDNCPKTNLKEVRVSDWIGINNYEINKELILSWHDLIKALTFRLKFVRDEKELEIINKDLIDSFYKMNIKEDEDFYSIYFKSLPEIKSRLGII